MVTPPNYFELSGIDVIAESIASRDNNNLYRTSCFFGEVDRYRAFCAQYAVMRVIDDRIDALPSRVGLSKRARRREQEIVGAWRRSVRAAHSGEPIDPNDLRQLPDPIAQPLLEGLVLAFKQFPVPLDLWEKFFDSMMTDLTGSRFARYEDFLNYAEGASTAPTTIYLYLLAAERQPDGHYQLPPDFELIRCGRALGVFAYLGHILRDLPDDLMTGEEGLLYLAGDDLQRHRLTEEVLFANLAAGRAGNELRGLVAKLVERARTALSEGRSYLTGMMARLRPDCAFILRLIIAIYEAILDKIAACDFDPMARRHLLTDVEKLNIVGTVTRQSLPVMHRQRSLVTL
jgi:phytoene/squalene synthetase